jgi:hypothetical protein
LSLQKKFDFEEIEICKSLTLLISSKSYPIFYGERFKEVFEKARQKLEQLGYKEESYLTDTAFKEAKMIKYSHEMYTILFIYQTSSR